MKEKTKTQKKRAVILAIIVLLLIIALTAGMYAYFTSTKTATNVFTIGNIKINLTEGEVWDAAVASGEAPASAQNIQPGQHIVKEPNVQNIGANPAFVYLKVYVPVIGEDDLFTYTTNATEGEAGGWTKRTGEEMHTTIDGQVYNIYTYEYDETLEPATTTDKPLFNEVIFANGMDFTPEQIEALGTVKNIIIKAYAIQSEAGVTKASNEITELMLGESNEEDGLAVETSGPSITEAEVGQYISLGGTRLLDNSTQADWRVFSKDAGGAWLILADYLPVGDGTVGKSTVVNDVGLTTSGTYIVRSTVDRAELITKLSTGNWSSLIAGTNAAGKQGVQVKGSVDLPAWVESWNANTGYTHLTATEDSVGYKIGGANSANLSGDDGYDNTLYYPHQEEVGSCYGYWLASPSAIDNTRVLNVLFLGRVSGGSCISADCGVRPAVYLPSNISLDTTGAVWSVAE